MTTNVIPEDQPVLNVQHHEVEEERSNSKSLAHSVSVTSVADFDHEQSLPCKNVAPKGPYADRYTNFCSAKDGAKTLFATDDWFACADNLLKDSPPYFDIDAYCEQVCSYQR